MTQRLFVVMSLPSAINPASIPVVPPQLMAVLAVISYGVLVAMADSVTIRMLGWVEVLDTHPPQPSHSVSMPGGGTAWIAMRLFDGRILAPASARGLLR